MPAVQQFHDLGDLELASGKSIENYRQSFVQHGRLNAARDNAVLITSSIAGNAHRLDFLIGPGRALDPAHYCIIATDAIGNGRSTSPSNSATQKGMAFPRFTIRDMVSAQARLVREKFGVDRLFAVVGASMGGMQALEWAVGRPDAMKAVVALVPLARSPAWTLAVNETTRKILMADAAWNGGDYDAQPEKGWRAWSNFMQVVVNRTPAGISAAFPHAPDVVGWMEGLEERMLASGFDANDWIYQTWAYDAHDVSGAGNFGGDVRRALASVRARTMVLGPPLDLYNPAEDQRDVAHWIPESEFVEIPSMQGHFASNVGRLADIDMMNGRIGDFLERVRASAQ